MWPTKCYTRFIFCQSFEREIWKHPLSPLENFAHSQPLASTSRKAVIASSFPEETPAAGPIARNGRKYRSSRSTDFPTA
jgi:hypothetical protein